MTEIPTPPHGESDALCFAVPLLVETGCDCGNPMTHCNLPVGHAGPHSWEHDRPRPLEAPPPAYEREGGTRG